MKELAQIICGATLALYGASFMPKTARAAIDSVGDMAHDTRIVIIIVLAVAVVALGRK